MKTMLQDSPYFEFKIKTNRCTVLRYIALWLVMTEVKKSQQFLNNVNLPHLHS